MKNSTSLRPVSKAVQNKIRAYRTERGKDPELMVLSKFYFIQLLEECGDATFSVPEHRFENTCSFQGVRVMADTTGILSPNEPYCILDIEKVIL